MNRASLLGFFAIIIYLMACTDSTTQDFSPKPKGYNRIDLPLHAYQKLEGGHPFTFEYSKSAIIQLDTFKNAEPHWIIVYYPKLDTRIQFTYKLLQNNQKKLQNLMIDAAKLAFNHDKKASSIADKLYFTKNGKKAVVFELEGEVPTPYQFFLTDSTQHYLRGAVYLMTATKNDSLRPIIDFMKEDSKHIMETLQWKK